MQTISEKYYTFHNWLFSKLKHIDGLPALIFRLYLGPIFIVAGLNKFAHMEDIINWFGNPEWGLGLPAPALMAYLATFTEIIGGWALVLGVAVRWFSIPLMITMIVAAITAHLDNGWSAIASGNAETSVGKFWAWFGLGSAEHNIVQAQEVSARLAKAKEILQDNGNYSWLTGKGGFVILQNGIEFAATYFIMLFSLLFTGAGRYVSIDYWLSKVFTKKSA